MTSLLENLVQPETWRRPDAPELCPTEVYCCQYHCQRCAVTWRLFSPDLTTVMNGEVRCGACGARGEKEWFVGPGGGRWFAGDAGCLRCGDTFPALCDYCNHILHKDD